MGAGSVPEEGRFRFSFNLARGLGFEGGHLETKGLDPSGGVIRVPLHRHEVLLDYLRLELELEYNFKDQWGLMLRVPYDIKNQKATVGFIEPISEEEREAIFRNRDIHHRTETYRGLSDFNLLANYRKRALFRESDFFKISFGATLPTGKTEEDPYRLGDAGLKHLHIQFGTGTFDPLLEVNYSTPLAGEFSLGAYALGRFPFYENRRTYRGPIEITSGATLGYRVSDRLFLHLNGTAYYQGFAYWDGDKDINSGLVATSAMFGVAIKTWKDASLGLDVRYPIGQRTLSQGDVFEQGPTVLLRISQTIAP